MKSRLLRRSLVLAALLLAGAAQAQVYKYVDREGRVHFSDRPQPGWTKVNVPGSNTVPAPKPRPAAGEDDEQLAKRAAECESRKQQLQNYQSATRILEKDALGRDREYSAEERQKLIELTEKQVAELCANPG